MNCETLKKENNQLKQDLKSIDEIYIKLVQQLAATEAEKENLEEQLKAIEEDGTEEHNAAFELRCKLAEALEENGKLKTLARKLYGTVLHVYALAKEDPFIIVGPELYKEAASGAKEYEEFYGQS